ncbi:MAG: ATP synthase F1 subunit delta [Oscillospiraceae bacterium]
MAGSVGNVYSEALFELAAEQDCAKETFDELMALKKIWKDNPELPKLLKSPTLSVAERLAVAEKIFKGKISEQVYNFICVITEKSRADHLPEIADCYKERWYDKSGIAEVTVTSDSPLTEKQREKLVAKLEKVYNKKIILEEKTDSSLIGGIKVNYNGVLMDGTVKTRLETLQRQIKGTIA